MTESIDRSAEPARPRGFRLAGVQELGLIGVIVVLCALLAGLGGSTERRMHDPETGKQYLVVKNKFLNVDRLLTLAKNTSFFAIMAMRHAGHRRRRNRHLSRRNLRSGGLGGRGAAARLWTKRKFAATGRSAGRAPDERRLPGRRHVLRAGQRAGRRGAGPAPVHYHPGHNEHFPRAGVRRHAAPSRSANSIRLLSRASSAARSRSARRNSFTPFRCVF